MCTCTWMSGSLARTSQRSAKFSGRSPRRESHEHTCSQLDSSHPERRGMHATVRLRENTITYSPPSVSSVVGSGLQFLSFHPGLGCLRLFSGGSEIALLAIERCSYGGPSSAAWTER